jgi:Caspase domain
MKDDYAVVVGIAKYPGLGVPPAEPADLQASEVDAQSIFEWLIAPNGGDVPKDNIRLIRTSDFPAQSDGGIGPQTAQIREAFRWLYNLAAANDATRKGMVVGRRLYIYMSGHGFSPSRSRGALYAANATPVDPVNTAASSWLEWFQDNGYFQEFVLWMDCCMDREFSVPEEPVFRPTGNLKAAGPSFIAFAATRPLKTVERAIAADQGKVHGVFTWCLLQGLKGGAINADGLITARCLGDYLINGMKAFLTADDLRKPGIAQEPEIAKADPLLIFAADQQRQSFPVTFRFPVGSKGARAQIWSDTPPAAESFLIDADQTVRSLGIGLYVIEVPDRQLRQGFEVTDTQGTIVDVNKQGNPVQPSSFLLTVDPRQPAAEIFLIDQQLKKQESFVGQLSRRLAFGLYKVKLRIGRSISETIVLLDRDINLQLTVPASENEPAQLTDVASGVALSQPQLASAAPLPGTAMTHEFHAGTIMAWSQLRLDRLPGDSAPQLPGSEIRLMARVWSGRQPTVKNVRPWEGTALLNWRGEVLSQLGDLKVQSSEGDPFVAQRLAVPAGNYFLRHRFQDGRELQQSLIVPGGWAVHAFLLADAGEGAANAAPERPLELNRGTVLMSRVGEEIDPQMDLILETARIALMDERFVLGRELRDLLVYKFVNPMAGILGGHLLVMAAEAQGDRPNLTALDDVVRNLRALVGDDHPDVEALSLRCVSPALRRRRPFDTPPMFDRSWRLILDAMQDDPDLLPETLWSRAQASLNVGGFLLWGCDSASKGAYLRQLAGWVATVKQDTTQLAAETISLSVPPAPPAIPPAPAFAMPASAPVPPRVAPREVSNSSSDQALSDLARRLRIPNSAFRTLWQNAPERRP